MFVAKILCEYDHLAWKATDILLPYIEYLPPGSYGYVVAKNGPSSVVSVGCSRDGEYFKYCQVVFDSKGMRPDYFQKPVKGTERETKMFLAKSWACENSWSEREWGNHNGYSIVFGDTVRVYMIPGCFQNRLVFGGSILFTFLNGVAKSKRTLHSNYWFAEFEGSPLHLEIVRNDIIIPDECDLMKFLTYKGMIQRMRIVTCRYAFDMTHTKDGDINCITTEL